MQRSTEVILSQAGIRSRIKECKEGVEPYCAESVSALEAIPVSEVAFLCSNERSCVQTSVLVNKLAFLREVV